MKTKKLLLISLILLLFPIIYGQVMEYCGDGICNNGEGQSTCAIDCRCVKEIIYTEDILIKEQTFKNEVRIPFFKRESFELLLNQTCERDANLDGLLCDPNEDFVSCPTDCEPPSLDSFLCIRGKCSWREGWFVRVLLLLIAGSGIFLFMRRRK